MPISATGSNPSDRCRVRTRGFTLLELLVVVAIIAIATAGVAFSLREHANAPLEREAQRLAALLEAARAQSRASGQVVRWQPLQYGFSFIGLPDGALPTHWTLQGLHAQPLDAQGRPTSTLTLGPDPIVEAQQVVLSSDDPRQGQIRVLTDGLRPFTPHTSP